MVDKGFIVVVLTIWHWCARGHGRLQNPPRLWRAEFVVLNLSWRLFWEALSWGSVKGTGLREFFFYELFCLLSLVYLRAVGGEVGATSSLAPKIGPLGLVRVESLIVENVV